MKYFIDIKSFSARVNRLTEDVDTTLRSLYEGKIIDAANIKALLEQCRLEVAEINARNKQCRPINNISYVDIDAPRIYIEGRQGFQLTITFSRITGDLLF